MHQYYFWHRNAKQPDTLQAELLQFLARLIDNIPKQVDITLIALIKNKLPLLEPFSDLIPPKPQEGTEKLQWQQRVKAIAYLP